MRQHLVEQRIAEILNLQLGSKLPDMSITVKSGNFRILVKSHKFILFEGAKQELYNWYKEKWCEDTMLLEEGALLARLIPGPTRAIELGTTNDWFVIINGTAIGVAAGPKWIKHVEKP